jgi:hypothetical protein
MIRSLMRTEAVIRITKIRRGEDEDRKKKKK